MQPKQDSPKQALGWGRIDLISAILLPPQRPDIDQKQLSRQVTSAYLFRVHLATCTLQYGTQQTYQTELQLLLLLSKEA